MTGVANRLTVTNGDGVSGDPTFDIANNYAGQATITTLGTISTGVWNGTAIAVSNGGTGATSVSAARTSLGLAIGTDVQAYNVKLLALANLTVAADQLIYATGASTYAAAPLTTFGRSLIDDADAGTARTTLGLAIGTNVQAQNVNLASIAGVTMAADQFLYSTDIGTFVASTVSAFGRSLIDDADSGAARTTLGLVIGTHVQAQNANLAALAGLTGANNKGFFFTGAGTLTTYDISAFGRSLDNAVDAAAARTTLALGSMSIQNSSAVAITGGTIVGITLDGGTF